MTTPIESVQTFKILIIGDSGVGKTSLMNRFVHGVYSMNHTATIGVDFKVAIVNIGDYKCRLQIWDTAGQERFRSLTSSYYRGADGIIIVYDVTSLESFDETKSRFPEFNFYCDENLPKILLGNKDDEDNQHNKVVSTLHGQELAKEKNLLFFETSVKDNKNITKAFNQLTKLVLQRRLDQSSEIQNTIVLPQKQSVKNDPKTCFCIV